MTVITDHLGETETADIAKLTSLIETEVPVSFVKTDDGRTFAARRDDFVLEQITPANAAKIEQPKWVKQSITVQKASSLRDYVKRFKNDGTLLFADIVNSRIVGAIDYHRAPDAAGGKPMDSTAADPSPRLGTHNVTLQLKPSEEWARWTGKNEKLMDQIEFADFLEENGMDVSDPTGADLLELCRDIHAMSGASIKSVVRQGDYRKMEVQRENSAVTQDGAELPVMFTIYIPVYFGESPIHVDCMTRVKVSSGQALFGYKMIRAEQHRQSEFNRIVEAVSVDTDTLAVYGDKGMQVPV